MKIKAAILAKIPDKILSGLILIFTLLVFTFLIHLFNHYDTSFAYVFHPADYTKVTGVIRNTYSQGSGRYHKSYANIDYEWNGTKLALRHAKRGLLDREGRKITLYVKKSSGRAVRGITVNIVDVVYVLLCVKIIYDWVARSRIRRCK